MSDGDYGDDLVGEAFALLFVAYLVGHLDRATCREIERLLFAPKMIERPAWAALTGQTKH